MINWGRNITIITTFDSGFFPGYCGLYNSARSNGFQGSFLVLSPDELEKFYNIQAFDKTTFRRFDTSNKQYSHYVNWMEGLYDLSQGDYIYMDCDSIIERPLGFMLQVLEEGPIVSAEAGKKYDPYDVLVARQCIEAGLNTDLRPFPYINDGFFAFKLPRDQEIIKQWVDLSLKHLEGIQGAIEDPRWYFLEQDVLNIILRQPGRKVFSISSNQIEIDDVDERFRNRDFPWTKQQHLQPKDKLKYVIHGAGLRRPWISPQGKLKASVEKCGILPWVRKLRGRMMPYERAWAYYACSKGMPVSYSVWSKQSQFGCSLSCLWKKSYEVK